MVSPERIRHRIEKIEISPDQAVEGMTFVDVVVGGARKWDLVFVHSARFFFVMHCISRVEDSRHIKPDGRFRDYLVSIMPPEVYAQCVGRALGARDG